MMNNTMTNPVGLRPQEITAARALVALKAYPVVKVDAINCSSRHLVHAEYGQCLPTSHIRFLQSANPMPCPPRLPTKIIMEGISAVSPIRLSDYPSPLSLGDLHDLSDR